MLTFLEDTLNHIKRTHDDISNLVLILPSKRAGGFLKNYLKQNAATTSFAPEIISIETFIERLSDLKIIDSSELLFKSYHAYTAGRTLDTTEDFESYTNWAITLLNDFNEVDRYLVDPTRFFSYLGSVKTLERWNMQDQQTDLVKKYLSFWNQLLGFYETLKHQLLEESIGYQGLVYRKAAEEIEHYVQYNGNKNHVFIGFNALNTAEQHIIQGLLETGNTTVYWDADRHFYEDQKHSASLFLRKYFSTWQYFEKNPPKFISDNFSKEKNITFVEVQKNIAQAKYVGDLLSGYSEEKLNHTALVLADESLLLPILHSLPTNVHQVNITMGVPLKTLPASVFFELVLFFQIKELNALYYKDILGILNHPLGIKLVPGATNIVAALTKDNCTHLSLSKLLAYGDETNKETLQLLFGAWGLSSSTALSSCLKIVELLSKQFSEHKLDHVALFNLQAVFSKISSLNEKFPHLKTVKSVQNLFRELINTSTLDFGGDAYNGLQIMGVLETRVLDFENVILTSVNEGVLPTGKSNASFITYDLKKEFNLPLFTEKDAIYTYHFYRLLHRANDITLVYNNHSEGINTGEKSRFLLQLEIEKHGNHNLHYTQVSPKIHHNPIQLKTVAKTTAIMLRLREIAQSGFSPSAMTSYIRNPMDFYLQKVLGVKEFEMIEETVAANTLGTIIHDALEAMYKPLEGAFLTVAILKSLSQQIPSEVETQFKRSFRGGSYDKGKNLIIYEIAKRYISNFISFEIAELNAGNSIQILQIETKLAVPIEIPSLGFPIKIGGKVDRVDSYNGGLRIIDYKTGKVEQRDLEIIEWESLVSDYKYSKAFQVLAYAAMINNDTLIEQVEAGIISFKNLQSGFLKFGTKPSPGSRTKDQIITQDTLAFFKVELVKLITEICTQEIPFIEKKV
ncbi:MAG: ATP-dependent helicase/nuclease subunit B [Candidatus Latescibacterota bacterium]|jgi:ATP-dependent helicase/nuclease subunit B